MDNIVERFRVSLNEMLIIKGLDSVSFAKSLGVDAALVRRWRNKGVDVRLQTLIKLADCFQCSIDYLCGKSMEIGKFVSKSVYPQFGERLLKVMKEHEVKPFMLFQNTAIKPSKYYYWINGGEPSLTSINAIATYLGITIDELVGRK